MTGLVENWPRYLDPSRHPPGCRCPACRAVETLARTAIRQAASIPVQRRIREGETPPGKKVILPGEFSGWWPRPPRPLSAVLRGEVPFGTKRQLLLYRVSLDPAAAARLRMRDNLLYIGMVHGRLSSITDRLRSHLKGTGYEASEIAKLRRALRALRRLRYGRDAIQVQYGRPRKVRLDPKLLRAYEAALQVIERPRSYVGSVTTFELQGVEDGNPE